MRADQISLLKFKTDYYEKFRTLLVREYGFNFGENRMEQFRSILLQFLAKSPYDTFDDFYHYLSSTAPGKLLFQQMMDEVTIGETYFFRNEPQLETFRDYVIPELIKTKRISGVPTIKIWSAGCSTGEEVYTNAMMLLETLPNPKTWDIQLLGTDINRRFLKIAQEGIYKGSRPQRHVDQALLEKYFHLKDEKFIVKNELKELIKFSYHNMVKDSFDLPQMIDADVIFCRNVTIYFNTETTRGIMNRFYDALRNGGFLFLGHSETLWQICDKFRVLDFPKGFIYKKDPDFKTGHIEKAGTHAAIPDINLNKLVKPQENQGQIRKSVPFEVKYASPAMADRYDTAVGDASLEKLMRIDAKYHEGVMHFENKDNDAALRCFDEIISLDKNYLIARFAKATILSNLGRYEPAMKELDYLIATDNLFLEAYYLQSVLYIKLNDFQKAIASLQKVIYIDPNHPLGYFHLATLYKDTGKLQQSRLSWTNLKRICQMNSKTDVVPMSDNLTFETLETLADKSLSEFR